MPPTLASRDLARFVAGAPEAAVGRLLTLACEQLGMDIAFVSVLDGAGNRTVRQSVHADGAPGPAGLTEPLDATWCGLVVEGGPMLVSDARNDESLQALPSTKAFSIASYAAVPLSDEDGTVFGTLCALGHEPRASLNARDLDLLVGLAGVLAPLVRALDAPKRPPPAMTGLEAVAAAVEGADNVERLTLRAAPSRSGYPTTSDSSGEVPGPVVGLILASGVGPLHAPTNAVVALVGQSFAQTSGPGGAQEASASVDVRAQPPRRQT
ncbi:GAF domain-containing protein [Nocardioides sp.]|uniref:GAF domain-containing protein n=1 Tax=Nocardioides sp. TaxID=35761 RepID=UPI002BC19FB4|nr:GAF domain-containing protein [Nocardioides sp.]HXH79964.1 GAF domain-containing protein [Nocardioides sp.]